MQPLQTQDCPPHVWAPQRSEDCHPSYSTEGQSLSTCTPSLPPQDLPTFTHHGPQRVGLGGVAHNHPPGSSSRCCLLSRWGTLSGKEAPQAVLASSQCTVGGAEVGPLCCGLWACEEARQCKEPQWAVRGLWPQGLAGLCGSPTRSGFGEAQRAGCSPGEEVQDQKDLTNCSAWLEYIRTVYCCMYNYVCMCTLMIVVSHLCTGEWTRKQSNCLYCIGIWHQVQPH